MATLEPRKEETVLVEDVDVVDRLPLEDCEEVRTKKLRLVERENDAGVSESPLGLKDANIAVERIVDIVGGCENLYCES